MQSRRRVAGASDRRGAKKERRTRSTFEEPHDAHGPRQVGCASRSAGAVGVAASSSTALSRNRQLAQRSRSAPATRSTATPSASTSAIWMTGRPRSSGHWTRCINARPRFRPSGDNRVRPRSRNNSAAPVRRAAVQQHAFEIVAGLDHLPVRKADEFAAIGGVRVPPGVLVDLLREGLVSRQSGSDGRHHVPQMYCGSS
jgi:hypothetical protein